MFFFQIFLGVNVGYVENSYSNSNNGGSVNSQDSLWQLKMGGNGSTGNGTHISRDDHIHMTERMNHYGNYTRKISCETALRLTLKTIVNKN